MIYDRCNLGPPPTKFTRLEQWPPDAWVQEPPDLIHCPTIAVTASPTGGKGESKGVACNTHPFQILDEKLYEKQTMVPAGENWAEQIVIDYEQFYNDAPEDWREATIREASGDGGFTHQGSFTPPHHLQGACAIGVTVENEGFADEQGAFVQRSPLEDDDWDLRVIKYVEGTDEPGTPFSYAWEVRYALLEHNEEFSPAPTAPEAPVPELPDLAAWIAGSMSVRGLRRPLVNSREKGSWYWRVSADSIYSEAVWPKDSAGNPVALVGAVRWTISVRERSVTDSGPGEWAEPTITGHREDFSLSPGDEWESDLYTIDESGGFETEVEQVVSNASVLIKYPSAIFAEPDYNAFPYF